MKIILKRNGCWNVIVGKKIYLQFGEDIICSGTLRGMKIYISPPCDKELLQRPRYKKHWRTYERT